MFKLRVSKSIIAYFSTLAFLILIYSIIFMNLMRVYEHRDYGLITAIYWVVMTSATR
jgi:hypothetical protein